MLYYNNKLYTELEDLEKDIANLPDHVKTHLVKAFLNEFDTPPLCKQMTAVTPRQFRLALIQFGISLEEIDHFINNLQEPIKSKAYITWEYAKEIQRSNPLLKDLAIQFGLSEEQLDEIFNLAMQL